MSRHDLAVVLVALAAALSLIVFCCCLYGLHSLSTTEQTTNTEGNNHE